MSPKIAERREIRRELRTLAAQEKALRKPLEAVLKQARKTVDENDRSLVRFAKVRQKVTAGAQREIAKAHKLFERSVAGVRQRRAILEGRLA
jgi:hypothetical protein